MATCVNETHLSNQRVFVAALGYERRSIQFLFAENLEEYDRVLVFDYRSDGIHSYDENKQALSANSISSLDLISNKREFVERISTVLSKNEGGMSTFTLDCSSFDRGLSAEILLALFRCRDKVSNLEVVYFPQAFSKPSLELDTVTKFGPVLPEFSGSSRSSSEKMCLIVGAGYEFGKVIGAQDSLEPDETIVFTPIGTDEKFEDAVLKANYGFEFIEDRDNIIKYDLCSPEEAFNDLYEIVRHKRATHRLLLLPMGPKIFALFSLLIAIKFHPDVRVWHFSTHKNLAQRTSNAIASGQRISLNFDADAIFAPVQN